jgi:cysteine desulfurase / selenocysteine lyase
MSTSEEDNARGFAERFPQGLPLSDTRGLAGSPPEVAMLTRMANEFFRAQPVPAMPAGVAPALPDAQGAAPVFETRLPQMGTSLPSMPPALSAYPVPGGVELPAVSSLDPNFATHLPQLGMPLPSVPAIPSAGGVPMAPELSPFMPGHMVGQALPAAAPSMGTDFLQHDVRTAGAGVAVSPFALPMPPFDAAFPSFEAGVPSLPALPPLRTEDEARSSLTAASPFYFLENAGALSKPVSSVSPDTAVHPVASSTAGLLQLDPRSAMASPFSLPMPEFDHTLFPSFEAGVPALAPLPPLRNEDDARAVLTDTSSFYFLPESGLPAASTRAAKTAGLAEPKAAPSHPANIGDLKLPRQQFDIASVRRDFPILRERVNGHPLIWLDNAATTQKPQSVIDRISYFYEHENSNIHRAAHELAARATDAYEDARTRVAHFLNASSSKEIVFVRGATEAINLVAQAWGRRHINKGDEIVITWIEHHANIVPWQMLCAEKGACLRVAPVDDDGQILLDEYEKLLSPKTRLVSFTQVSNALGTITPAHQMVQMAHRYGARVLVDGAQAVSHMPIDVQSLDCDFYVFSGHKVFAPTGIGVLYGKPEVLAETPPWQGGGNMIVDVTFEKTTYQPPPGRFEAGTGNIADAVGLGAAIDYLDHVGMPNVARYEHELLVYATRGMLQVPGLRIIGTAKEKAGVLSFVLDGYRTEEVGAALNREGIAVRSGHHCAQPTLRRFGVETTVRPSLALYNSFEDIDALIAALFRLKRIGA